MLVVRPIRKDDYSQLFQIAEESGHGFTSLPVNEELLRNKIARSEASVNKEVEKPGDEGYLFVLEDTQTGKVVGTSGIEAAVGMTDAFYHYHMGKVVHSSQTLNVYNTVDILTLCNDYTGMTEICSLFLRESHRKGNNGRLLSKSRFLFLAEHKQRFAETVLAEMRGVSDEDGKSPFWKWLEEHFFSMDFPTADYLTGIGQKVFIAELMPKIPIYVNLLSKEAQAVIGKVHDKTRPALQLLKTEGFVNRGYIDIFDGGPTVEANVDNIKSVRISRRLKVKIGEPTGETQEYLICNSKGADYRASSLGLHVTCDSEEVVISAEVAGKLLVCEGDMVRVAKMVTRAG
ncbi:MAG: arginine N-succinyltransferase [Psychrosphaera sp.]|nr:arginine N-succinyltransferase [Psychrosphaera sp.]